MAGTDLVKVMNMPDSGSPANVAFKLMERIQGFERKPDATEARAYFLDLYAECIYAANGLRDRPKS